MQVGKQGMHSGSPWSGRTANCVPNANDTIADVAAGQRLFIIVPHRTSVSDRPVMITPLRGSVRVGTEVKGQADLRLHVELVAVGTALTGQVFGCHGLAALTAHCTADPTTGVARQGGAPAGDCRSSQDARRRRFLAFSKDFIKEPIIERALQAI
ncbi:hypothetical protein [Streptomyces sp. CoH27]|uniref:hypothetical protein n=1 Tax=Streptomyces sp. CoH27 TaxID=2875763 RepID=UPI001CD77D2B|nr:hypothetical protein [Streptomyces sp. CoH27]